MGIATRRNLSSRVFKNSTRTQELRSGLCAINRDAAKHGPQNFGVFQFLGRIRENVTINQHQIRLHARCERSDFVLLIQSARRIARVGEAHRFARHALGSIEHVFAALASFSLVDCPQHIWTGNEPVTRPRDSVLPYMSARDGTVWDQVEVYPLLVPIDEVPTDYEIRMASAPQPPTASLQQALSLDVARACRFSVRICPSGVLKRTARTNLSNVKSFTMWRLVLASVMLIPG